MRTVMRTTTRQRSLAAFFVLALAAMVTWSATGHAEGGAGGFRCYTCD